MPQITTNEVGAAIRDALNLLKDGIETSVGQVFFWIEDSDPSNLRVVLDQGNGAFFRISIIRED